MDKSAKVDYVKIIMVGIPLTFILWGVAFLLLRRLTQNPATSLYAAIGLATIFLPIYFYLSIKYADKLDASREPKSSENISNNKQQDSRRRISVPMLRFGAVIGWIVMTLSALQKIGNIKMIGILFGVSIMIVSPLCLLAWKYRSWIANTKKGRGLAPLSIPIGLFFWKWISSVSVIAEHISMFAVVLLVSFMVFFFEKDNLKW